MTYQYISAAYVIINLLIAIILLVKLRRSFISRFFILCILLLTLFGLFAFILDNITDNNIRRWLEPAVIFLYSMIPFFSFHFMANYFRFANILKPFSIVIAIYITGLFSYTLALLEFIPRPFLHGGGLTVNGYIYFITWMSIFLGTGIAQLFTVLSGYAREGIKSKILFTLFTVLLLSLPGPFAETFINQIILGDSRFYFITSFLSLIIIIYGLFRYKTSINVFDSLKMSLTLLSDIIIKTDANLKIELIKGAVGSTLEYSENDLIGRRLTEIVSETEYVEGYYNYVISDKMEQGFFDANIISKSGSTIPFSFSLTPVVDNEIITGFISIARNISDRKEMEKLLVQSNAELEEKVKERTKQLQKLNADLEKDIDKRKEIEKILSEKADELKLSNKTKDRLFSIIAHDLRNPFTTLMGTSEFLAKNFADMSNEELKTTISNIHSSSVKIYDLLENLLEWSRIRTQKSEYSPEWFSPGEVVKKIIALFEDAFSYKRVIITNLIPAGLKIFSDKNSVSAILRNLIINAIKFSHFGGNVEITLLRNFQVEIHVRDFGVGIDPEHIASLFLAGDKHIGKGTANEKGTGLGLPLCLELAEKCGGKIMVESDLGKGSNFMLMLPDKSDNAVE